MRITATRWGCAGSPHYGCSVSMENLASSPDKAFSSLKECLSYTGDLSSVTLLTRTLRGVLASPFQGGGDGPSMCHFDPLVSLLRAVRRHAMIAYILAGYSACTTTGCVASLTVLRISFGLSCFFFIMLVTTAGAKEEGSCRDWWHSGWWPFKILGYLLLLFLPFLLPYREYCSQMNE